MSNLHSVPEEALWAELERRKAAILCGYTYPAMASDADATALIHEHGYEFGPWQHLELGERLAEPPHWRMYARVPEDYPRDDIPPMETPTQEESHE